MAEAVVGGALLRIAQDAIGLGGFLEFFLGVVIAGIAVGMMLQGELAVGRLEHRLVAVPGYTEDFIIVSFGHAHFLTCRLISLFGSTATLTMAGRSRRPLKL